MPQVHSSDVLSGFAPLSLKSLWRQSRQAFPTLWQLLASFFWTQQFISKFPTLLTSLLFDSGLPEPCEKAKEPTPFFKPGSWSPDGEHPHLAAFFSQPLRCRLSRKTEVLLCPLLCLPLATMQGGPRLSITCRSSKADIEQNSTLQ